MLLVLDAQVLEPLEMAKPLDAGLLSSPPNSTLLSGPPVMNTPVKLHHIRQEGSSEPRMNSSIALENGLDIPTASGES